MTPRREKKIRELKKTLCPASTHDTHGTMHKIEQWRFPQANKTARCKIDSSSLAKARESISLAGKYSTILLQQYRLVISRDEL